MDKRRKLIKQRKLWEVSYIFVKVKKKYKKSDSVKKYFYIKCTIKQSEAKYRLI